MAASLKVRCTTCDESFADTATNPCPVCASLTWEPCVYDPAPSAEVEIQFRHRSGAAIFAYDEAAKAGISIPGWAAPAIPANTAAARREALAGRLSQAIAANSTFLAISGTLSNAQRDAQLRSLTRQVQAMLRLQVGQLDAVD